MRDNKLIYDGSSWINMIELLTYVKDKKTYFALRLFACFYFFQLKTELKSISRVLTSKMHEMTLEIWFTIQKFDIIFDVDAP